MKKLTIILMSMLMIAIVTAGDVQTLNQIRQYDNITLKQNCVNVTYVNITSIGVTGLNTVELLSSPVSMTLVSNGFQTYLFTNNTLIGKYIVTGICNENLVAKAWSYDYEVTPNGQTASGGTAVFYIGLLAVLLLFFVLCIYSFVHFDNLLSRVGMLGLGYLILIAITFIGWNMAKDFITSAPFLIEMLWILFLVLIIGLFPLLIGAFAYYFLMLWKIKEIERLMDKGFSMEDAQRRTSKR